MLLAAAGALGERFRLGLGAVVNGLVSHFFSFGFGVGLGSGRVIGPRVVIRTGAGFLPMFGNPSCKKLILQMRLPLGFGHLTGFVAFQNLTHVSLLCGADGRVRSRHNPS